MQFSKMMERLENTENEVDMYKRVFSDSLYNIRNFGEKFYIRFNFSDLIGRSLLQTMLLGSPEF